jgi:hypothetical protein
MSTPQTDLAVEREQAKAELTELVGDYLAANPEVAAQYAAAVQQGGAAATSAEPPAAEKAPAEEIVARVRAVTVAALRQLLADQPDLAALPAADLVHATAKAVDDVLAELPGD